MHSSHRSSLWAVVVVVLLVVVPRAATDFQLTILHTNDVHARFDETSVLSSPCSDADAKANKCYGGSARLVTAVKEARQMYNNTLLLDGGDQYQGTVWFFYFGVNITPIFVNHLGYDAIAIGNHEFDRGVSYLLPYYQTVNVSIVCANINATLEPDLNQLLNKHVIKTVGGQRIGIIGYSTPEIPELSSPGPNLKFGDVLETVRAEVDVLTQQGVNKIIALGHAGYTVDKLIAAIPGVDVVVGGHSHTFLYNVTNPADQPSTEVAEGDYPTVVTQDGGGTGLVVQAYAYSKYLGILHVTFDDNGTVLDYSGKPRLLNGSVEKDNETLEMLEPWREKVTNATKNVIGKTLVKLEGSSKVCRMQECNLGNLIADGMVVVNRKLGQQQDQWTDVSIALMNGGGIRDTIEKGDVSVANILGVMPFQNTVDAITIKGKYLVAALEHSVFKYNTCNQSGDAFGGFLQVSGLRVKYDLSKPVGQRVVSVDTLCTDCLIPQFVPLEEENVYKVLLPSFTRKGGDGYVMFRDNASSTDLINALDSDVFTQYVKDMSPITQGLDGRIAYIVGPNDCPNDTSTEAATTPSSSCFSSGVPALAAAVPLVYFATIFAQLYH